jgi:hypothetical protein
LYFIATVGEPVLEKKRRWLYQSRRPNSPNLGSEKSGTKSGTGRCRRWNVAQRSMATALMGQSSTWRWRIAPCSSVRPVWLCLALSNRMPSTFKPHQYKECAVRLSLTSIPKLSSPSEGILDGKRSDNSTARQLAPRNAVVVDKRSIARSRKPTNISFGPLKSVKQKSEQRSSSSFVYVSVKWSDAC